MNLKNLGALAASATFLVLGLAAPANAYPHVEPGKVTICHATGSTTNPYVEQSVAYASILGDGHGHSGVNAGDIIPSFTADDGQVFPGQNFSADNQHIWENDCAVPATTPIPTPVVTPTPTPTPVVTPTPTPTPTTPPVTACPGVVTDQPGLKNMAGGPDAPCPPVQSGPAYVSVIWLMPDTSTGQSAAFPQSIVNAVPEKTPTFRAFPTLCGKKYQQDIYWNNATTVALIAIGQLTAPNHPAESLIPGGLGTAWEFHTNAPCVTPTPTPTPVTTPTPQKPAPTPETYVPSQTVTPAPAPATVAPEAAPATPVTTTARFTG